MASRGAGIIARVACPWRFGLLLPRRVGGRGLDRPGGLRAGTPAWLILSCAILLPACQPPRVWERPFRAHPRVRLAAAGHGTWAADLPIDESSYLRLREEVEVPGGASAGRLLALADYADREGCRLIPRDPVGALPWFRDAAAFASFGLASADDPSLRARAVARHNHAVEELLRCAGTGPQHVDHAWRARLASVGVALASTNPARADLPYQELWIARDFRVENLELVGQDGLGVPLVTVSVLPDRDAVPGRFLPRRLTLPATAVIRPGGPLDDGEWRRRPALLALHDPAQREEIPLGTTPGTIALAADLTTPLVSQLKQAGDAGLANGGLLRPDEFSSVPGIFMQAPREPGKIPVLFIHGLWSDPQAWLIMANALQADPLIRDRYQFWYAYYPTGASLAFSAERVRRELGDLIASIDPHRSDPSIDRMVVVGHSLGGVLSKQLLQSSGRRLEQGLFTRPFEEVAMSPETRERLSRILDFEPVPSVRRAVFIASPHLGSNAANGLIGRVSTLLVRRTKDAEALRRELIGLNGPEVFTAPYRRRPPSSIDNLERGSPILQALSELPIAPGVPYHSIIGNILPGAPERLWTDGVVPFESAQLDGAESELVVRHNHSANEAPGAVAEVRRILRLHLGVGSVEQADAAPGPAIIRPTAPGAGLARRTDPAPPARR